MLMAMIGLSFYVYSWCKNAYIKEKENLLRETGFILNNAVRQLEDSLIQNVWVAGSHKPFRAKHRVLQLNNIPKDSAGFHVFVDSLSNFNPRQTAQARRLRSRLRADHNKAFVGSISLQLRFAERNENELINVLDTTAHKNTLPLLKEYFHRSADQQNWPFQYDLLQLPDSNQTKNSLYSRPFMDLTTHIKYAVKLQAFHNYLLHSIRPEILISLLLITIIAMSFGLALRNIIKQSKLMQMKNDLISNITHELKTPISIVSVALEALQNFNASDDSIKRQEYLDISQHEINRLSSLVEKVLRNAIHTEKEWQLSREWFDMRDLISQILKSMQLQFEKVNAQVAFNVETENYMYYGDRLHFSSVIYNLIDNALKYCKGVPRLNISIKQEANNLLLVFADQGIGIEKQYLSNVFDRFFRVPNENIHNYKGYGLGLSYVQNVITKHDGRITVSSKINEGTSFSIQLPNIIDK